VRATEIAAFRWLICGFYAGFSLMIGPAFNTFWNAISVV